ncbi:hypothetical protein [Aurantiacibacter rhizosphaerae]|uniref:Uncharacterized protein n=1 Tax=Aurantiacibacter rhizosphaerae TaxID=2691582 RepID=A0A844XHY5_9SPHN|nr:hypothetical protein [Aurantiacibacter rhizosphaerae]MWV29165.1 hypothetical protein [Aurantiacibacter rhizosphaerae]
MSTDPIGVNGGLSTILPHSPVIARTNTSAQTQPRLPDHYAMETPEGVVEVHELALRGRLKDRYGADVNYDYSYEDDIASMEAKWDETKLDARAERALAQESPASASAPTQQAAALTTVPHYSATQQARTGENVANGAVEIADGVIEIESPKATIGNAKMINVAGELAALN